MRVNIYAEEMTDKIELITKVVEGHTFTALRFYLQLPTTFTEYVTNEESGYTSLQTRTVKGPFIHRPGDDDSSAVTFWGKEDLRPLLQKALTMLDAYYSVKE